MLPSVKGLLYKYCNWRRTLLAITVYEIWTEKSSRFQTKSKSCCVIVRQIQHLGLCVYFLMLKY